MGAVGVQTAVADEGDLLTVARMELVLLLATMPTRMATQCHRRTDNQRDSHTRHHNKALAGMGGTEGRRCRVMVGLEVEVGLRDLREVRRTVEVLGADMGSLAILSRTDEEATVVVVGTVVQGLRKGVMVVTVLRMGRVVVHMAVVAVVANTMELQEVEGVVVGSAVIYLCIFSLVLMDNEPLTNVGRNMKHNRIGICRLSFTLVYITSMIRDVKHGT